MADAKRDNSLLEIKKQWENFVQLIYQDLRDLLDQQRKNRIEIRKLERVEKVIQHSKDNIEFLILHKETLLSLDPSLEKSFKILEAFKGRNNLDNAVAIRTYKGIVSSPAISKAKSTLISLKGSRDVLDESIDKIKDLITGTAYDKETISKLCRKNGLSEEQIKAILIYPLLKTSRKEKPKKVEVKRKTPEKNVEEVKLEKPVVKMENTKVEEKQEEKKAEEITQVIEEEVKEERKLADESYEDFYNEIKSKYNYLNSKRRPLINKYFVAVNNMSETLKRSYIKYLTMESSELEGQTEEEFANREIKEKANIAAIKLFDMRKKINGLIDAIEESKYRDVESIDILEKSVRSFEIMVDELKALDKEVQKEEAEKEIKDNTKVFFATERGEHFIPDFIKEQGNEKSLAGIIRKGQLGLDEEKNERITRLKIYDSKYKEECGNNFYAITNYSVVVSYIKIKAIVHGEEQDAILILTAIPAEKGGKSDIQKVTKDLLKKHRDTIIRQIKAIEKGDVQEIGLQLSLLEEMMQEYDTSKKEGSKDGKKPKQLKQDE